MNKLRILFLILAFLFTLIMNSIAQEQVHVVYLKDGSKVVGTIIEQIPNVNVKIKTKDGRILVYTLDKVKKITKELIGTIEDLRDVSYYELGLNFGTPAGFNGVFGYWFSPVGLRLSGMYYGKVMQGIQFNIGYRIADNTKRYHSIAAVVGSSKVKKKEWEYLGLVYNLYFRGFFLETGLSIGKGSYSSPQLVLQIGYLYRVFPFFIE